MCGRFTLTIELEVLFERFSAAYPFPFEFKPSYNIAPTHPILAVVRGERGNKMGHLRWGLVPSWAKDTSMASKMINARSETVHEKPSFKTLIHRQRCLVIADSFYEWKRENGVKTPFRIMLEKGEPFAFAGLWSVWKQGGQALATCTILTAAANAFMSPIHERMPVILNQKDEEAWLNPANTFYDVKPLLNSFPENEMIMYSVSDKVNNPRYNESNLLEPAVFGS